MNQHFVDGFEKQAVGLVAKGLVAGRNLIRGAVGATGKAGNWIAGQGKPGGMINRVGTAIAKNPGTVTAAGAAGAAGVGTGLALGGGNGN